MELSRDELAGVVDLFGALPPADLVSAGEELAYKRGTTFDGDNIDDAITTYHLVRFGPDDGVVEGADEPLLAAGPAAFPVLPDGAEDLPHIFDREPVTPDRAALGTVVEERFRTDAARALGDGTGGIDRLLDTSYDIETWAPVDLGDIRDRLDAAAD